MVKDVTANNQKKKTDLFKSKFQKIGSGRYLIFNKILVWDKAQK